MSSRRKQVGLLIIPLLMAGMGFLISTSLSCNRQCRSSPLDAGEIASAIIATIICGAVGLVIALAIGALSRREERVSAGLHERYPDSLVITARIDHATMAAAAALDIAVKLHERVFVVVGLTGLRICSGRDGDNLAADYGWNQLTTAELGDPRGDVTLGGASISSVQSYERLAISVTRDSTIARLQFPVILPEQSLSRGFFADAHDIRRLTRRINGFKAVFEREQGR